MRDQCLLWENYPPPQEAEGGICHCGECWDVGKRLGKRNRLDFWSAAPQEQNMVTLQPKRKLPPRPNLFQILISAFSCPAESLIKCTVHTNIEANKTQWNPNNNHSFVTLPWQARARAVRSVGDVPWRWRDLHVAEQLGKDGRREGEVQSWGLCDPTAVLQAPGI